MVGPIAGAKVAVSAYSAKPDRLLRLRQLGQHQGEGHGDQHAAGEPLQRTQNDHLAKVVRKGAGHGEGQEQNGVDEEIAPEREDAAEIVAQRNDNDLADEIGGRDPGAVVDPGPDAALDIEQRCIGDLDVQHRHEGAKQRAEHHRPGREARPIGRVARARNCIQYGHDACLRARALSGPPRTAPGLRPASAPWCRRSR